MIIEIPYDWFWYKKYRGITIFNIILVKDKSDERLIKHELRHVEQWRKERFTFHLKYFYYLYRYGYWLNPYEVDARNAEHIP